jgi:CelD/BcsL family acetyltransferase involved in cellulose biosynthesis
VPPSVLSNSQPYLNTQQERLLRVSAPASGLRLDAIHHDPDSINAPYGAEVVRTSVQFDRLQSEWNTLFEECGTSAFQSFEWQRTWWECFGEDRQEMDLHIIVLRSGTRTVGIAPFYVECIRLTPLWSLRRLAFVGSGVSDYLDVLVTPGYEEAIVGLVSRLITDGSIRLDMIHLEDIPERSPIHLPLFRALSESSFKGRKFIAEYCPRTSLQESWERTLASFPSHRRKRILYQRHSIPRHFPIAYERPSNGSYSDRDFDEFVRIHQDQWKNMGRTGVFADERAVTFHRKIARLFADRGWLFLTFLKINGRRVAANYGFKVKEELCTYLNGMLHLTEVAKYSPGRVLHGFTIEDGIRHGASVYDFLRGTERYKYSFNAVGLPNWTILMYNPDTFKAEWKFRIHLLQRSLRRRGVQEVTMCNQVLKEHGLLSKEVLKHVLKRTRRVLKDGIKKAQEPEKPIMIFVSMIQTSIAAANAAGSLGEVVAMGFA